MPRDSLKGMVGSTLYGTTANARGGSAAAGTVFSINPDGTGFSLLHTFTGGDGYWPLAGLTVSGSPLFGVTSNGGSDDDGTIFSINTDGSGFAVLHSFTGANGDGAIPDGDL